MTVREIERPLDVRLARAAIAWTLEPVPLPDDVADRLVALAGGNRTAVARALCRVASGGRAATALRQTLARGRWAW